MEIYLPEGKKIYFASDFHLGTPNLDESRSREKKIVRWLESIQQDAHTIFLLGDIFDFWFEYKRAVPKGFVRFQGKLAELSDAGINIIFFTGNHDMWMFDYFPKEFGIPIYREPIELTVNEMMLMIGHGDGLGPGDYSYKLLKKIFSSNLSQWMFARFHPNFGIGIAQYWSKQSRIAKGEDHVDKGENEWLVQHCREVEKVKHHDIYVFGHRHLSMSKKIGEHSMYYNLGEWVFNDAYGEFDGKTFELRNFKE